MTGAAEHLRRDLRCIPRNTGSHADPADWRYPCHHCAGRERPHCALRGCTAAGHCRQPQLCACLYAHWRPPSLDFWTHWALWCVAGVQQSILLVMAGHLLCCTASLACSCSAQQQAAHQGRQQAGLSLWGLTRRLQRSPAGHPTVSCTLLLALVHCMLEGPDPVVCVRSACED